MPSNTAAWLVGPGKPLEVKKADYSTPADNEIVIDIKSIALNPCDWAFEMLGTQIFPDLTYPSIVGEDVAGDVVTLGSSVTRFKVGDRVTCMAKAAFQKYPAVCEYIACPIPASMSYKDANVVPLGLTTALIKYVL